MLELKLIQVSERGPSRLIVDLHAFFHFFLLNNDFDDTFFRRPDLSFQTVSDIMQNLDALLGATSSITMTS